MTTLIKIEITLIEKSVFVRVNPWLNIEQE